MDKFTQLHLGSKTSRDNSGKERTKSSTSRQKVLLGCGLLAVTALSGVLLLITNGCSKGQKLAPMTSNQTVGPTTAASLPASAPMITDAVKPAKPAQSAHRRTQRKAPTATYSDPIHGVSFRYPKNSVLKTGDEPNIDLAGMGPMQMNFVEPGGISVAAVELPHNSYPGTDFSSAFFSVSVHPELTTSECGQFASLKSEPQENNSASPSPVKIGGVNLQMIEDFGGARDGNKSEPVARYYHRFENGNCYEFGMEVGTDKGAAPVAVKPVNREQVFRKLEQILATVKVQPPVVPEVAKDAPAHPVVDGSKE